jgi:H+/Cl- antiporter ClcA
VHTVRSSPLPTPWPQLLSQSVCARVCMALSGTGVLAGVFRSAISLVVLVVEGTRGIDYLFGVILSVVIANWVAHHIHHDGVYESELEKIGELAFAWLVS